MSKIEKTINYSQFKFLQRNRNVNANDLMESIKKKNMLHLNPIIVDEKFNVIDGQHRLFCAKSLNLPIYYIVDDVVDEEDIAQLQIQKKWEIGDFLHFYKDKLPLYNFIDLIAKKHSIISVSFIIKCINSTSYSFKLFRDGEFTANESFEYYQEKFFMLAIILKEVKHKKIPFRESAMRAVWNLIKAENFDIEIFMHKIDQYPDDLLQAFKFYDAETVTKLMLQLYNKGQKKYRI